MKIVKYPERSDWQRLLERPYIDVSKLNGTVADILDDVRKNGDDAVRRYEAKFDGVSLASLAVCRKRSERRAEKCHRTGSLKH